MKKIYAKIYALSVGTTPTILYENQNRVGLLIQNNSSNTLYLLSQGNDTAQSIVISAGATYRNDVAPQGEYQLIASAATSDIRVEEDICQS